MRLTETVKQLLIINIIMFIGASLSGDVAYSLFGLHFPKSESFHFWQVISHMFMHGSLSHILFNMLALWMFGVAIEGVLGSKRFLFFITCYCAKVHQKIFWNQDSRYFWETMRFERK